ncbi:MAG TPA: VanZ family protein [Gammaproteobacteria bacterium]|nr:VanZ family protein [Gammaproteobacteria bacterium]
MLPLRYPWFWMCLGWLLVIGVCVGSLVPGDMLRTVSIGDKVLHAGSYFLLMVWFAGLYSRRRHVWIAVILLGLGIVLDAAQGGTATRTFDLRDIFAGGLGILFGLVLSFWLLEGWCQRLERLLFAVGP